MISDSQNDNRQIIEAFMKLLSCTRTVALYGRYHPLVRTSASEAQQMLATLTTVQPNLALAVTDSTFVIDNYPLEDPTGSLRSFAEALGTRHIGEIKICSGLTSEEIVEFSEAISMPPEEILLKGNLSAELSNRGVSNIQLKGAAVPIESREAKDPADIYEEALQLVEDAMRAVQSGLQIPVAEIRNVVSDSLQCMVGDESALLALAGIRSYDRYLSEHSVNVCILSMVLSRELGLPASVTVELGLSAMLHDVGKVFVSPVIVKKPGRLTEDEWQQIRRHPAEGARALAGITDLPALASTIALEHHMHCDGGGYPARPNGTMPHLLSRLVAIVDTYDALTTDRPYRERWTADQAIAYLLYEAWRQYDHQLLARFAGRVGLHPIGSLVKLTNGGLAVVVSGNHDTPHSPTVQLVNDDGTPLSEGHVMDLSDDANAGIRIAEAAQPIEALLPYTERLIAA